MNKQSIFFSCLTGVIATAVMFLSIRRQLTKNQISADSNPSTLGALQTVPLLITFFIFLRTGLEQVENTIEILIYDPSIENTFWAVMQKIAIFMGFVFMFTWGFNFITDWLLRLIYGKTDREIEIRNSNIPLFTIRAVCVIFLAYAITPMFQHLLQWFTPVVETPFYH